jgi:hypothetical protein
MFGPIYQGHMVKNGAYQIIGLHAGVEGVDERFNIVFGSYIW